MRRKNDAREREIVTGRFDTFLSLLRLSALLTFAGVVATIAGYVLIFSILPQLETAFFPVGGNFIVTQVDSDLPGYRALRVTGEKYRDCRLIKLIGFVDTGNHVQVADLQHKRDSTIPNIEKDKQFLSLPPGRFSFGTYYFRPIANKVWVEAYHDCGMPWTTRSRMFQWQVSLYEIGIP